MHVVVVSHYSLMLLAQICHWVQTEDPIMCEHNSVAIAKHMHAMLQLQVHVSQ